MSEQKRPTPQRSSASTTRRRERTQRSSSPKRGGGHGISEWLRALLAHAALFFATLGQRIRRIGPRARTVMRESKARNFPESNRFLVQVFLVIGGMFPMWHSLLHEKLQVRRRQRNHAAGTHADRWRRRARRHGHGSRHEKDRREAVFLCAFACGREDGCFAAPAASRCCACGRKLGRFVPRHE